MDLAKIRKKSLQTSLDPGGERLSALPVAPLVMDNTPVTVSLTPLPAAFDLSQKESPFNLVDTRPVELPLDTAIPIQPIRAALFRSPMEAILAGRSAAGCDEESINTEETSTEVVTVSSTEFLCFRVSDEIYGINIMDIKEIIKPREVTEVPRAPLFVSGVLSLRGTIIPIIDMRIRLGLKHEVATGKERVIVIKNDSSFGGLLVDEVIQVVQIPQDAIEAAPTVLDGIDRDFVSGIGRSEGRLIIILNLGNIADINLY